MMSAFVPASAQIVTGPLDAGDPPSAGAAGAAAPAAELRLQLRREVFGVGVVQVPDQGVAALGRRHVEMRDQRPHLQLDGAVAGQQHAVRAWVGYDLDRRRAADSLSRRVQLAEHPHDVVG